MHWLHSTVCRHFILYSSLLSFCLAIGKIALTETVLTEGKCWNTSEILLFGVCARTFVLQKLTSFHLVEISWGYVESEISGVMENRITKMYYLLSLITNPLCTVYCIKHKLFHDKIYSENNTCQNSKSTTNHLQNTIILSCIAKQSCI